MTYGEAKTILRYPLHFSEQEVEEAQRVVAADPPRPGWCARLWRRLFHRTDRAS